MIKLTLVKITFEALGKEHIAYTEKLDFDYINDTVEMICPTAIVTNVCTDIVDASVLKNSSLEGIRKWSNSLSGRFSHLDKEALL